MYFSLTTLTTMGYGDITPVNVFARSLANLESLDGQLYPASIDSKAGFHGDYYVREIETK